MTAPRETICLIYAEDWSIHNDPEDRAGASFPVYCAWVVGFLIKETKDSITVSMEIFGDKVRHTQTIPKSAIRFRKDRKA